MQEKENARKRLEQKSRILVICRGDEDIEDLCVRSMSSGRGVCKVGKLKCTDVTQCKSITCVSK